MQGHSWGLKSCLQKQQCLEDTRCLINTCWMMRGEMDAWSLRADVSELHSNECTHCNQASRYIISNSKRHNEGQFSPQRGAEALPELGQPAKAPWRMWCVDISGWAYLAEGAGSAKVLRWEWRLGRRTVWLESSERSKREISEAGRVRVRWGL